VLGFTSDLPEEALGLALYAHFVVVEAFRRSGATFRKIEPGNVERKWKDNFGFINDLRAAGYTRSPFQLQQAVSSEPAVMRYVIDVSCIVLAISATYEIFEWTAALVLGQGADEFWGTQGDSWDTQSDMLFALIGAVTALLLFSRAYDRQIERLPFHG